MEKVGLFHHVQTSKRNTQIKYYIDHTHVKEGFLVIYYKLRCFKVHLSV